MPEKPVKPYADFPLFAHASGQWAKKIRGKMHYFGVWSDPQAALDKYCEQRDDLQAGRTPRVQGDGLTIKYLCNAFLTAKQSMLDSAELSARTMQDYRYTCEGVVVPAFGKSRQVDSLTAADFERLRSSLAKVRGPVSLGNEIQRIRTLFKYGHDAGLIEKPVRFGPMFRKPGRRRMREVRHAAGPRLFTAEELRKIIAAAPQPLRAMVLLGANCGFGQSDIAGLPIGAVDLESGWITYPRPKTAVPRRCPLWPESVATLREMMQDRPVARSEKDADLMFLTVTGRRWVRTNKTGTPDDAIGKEFAKLLKGLGIKRAGVSFYGLRRIVETIGGECKDQVAVDAVMGHALDDMASRYREFVSDDRLLVVTTTVREWLYPPDKLPQDRAAS